MSWVCKGSLSRFPGWQPADLLQQSQGCSSPSSCTHSTWPCLLLWTVPLSCYGQEYSAVFRRLVLYSAVSCNKLSSTQSFFQHHRTVECCKKPAEKNARNMFKVPPFKDTPPGQRETALAIEHGKVLGVVAPCAFYDQLCHRICRAKSSHFKVITWRITRFCGFGMVVVAVSLYQGLALRV